jgi:hypothetical protein
MRLTGKDISTRQTRKGRKFPSGLLLKRFTVSERPRDRYKAGFHRPSPDKSVEDGRPKASARGFRGKPAPAQIGAD